MIDTNLLAPFEMTGRFWLPMLPSKPVYGTLRFGPGDGTALELGGMLDAGKHLARVAKWPLVLGELRDGTKCSLWHVLQGSTHLNLESGAGFSQVTADYCFLGQHLEPGKDALFRSCDIEYTELTTWMGRAPLKGAPKAGESGVFNYTVDYREPGSIRISPPGLGFTLSVTPRFRASHGDFGRLELQHREGIRLRPARVQPLDWHLSRMRELRNLLSLLVMEPVYMTQIELQSGSHHTRSEGHTREVKDWATLLVPQGLQEPVRPDRHPRLVPFRYEVVRAILPALLHRWFSDYERLRSVYNLFFLPRYSPHMTIGQQFLGLVQSLEGFHRTTASGSYLSQDQFAKVYRTLADSIPAGVSRELRQALADRLRYGNEFSLRRRLAEIVGALSSESQALIDPRLPDFMRKVVDTRNYLVHLDSRLKHRAMTETEMIEAMRPLGALLMLVVFVRIGIPEEFARDVLRESNQFERTRVIDWEEGT